MGLLYLIPTPIGNLEDITLRAIRTLKECDFLLAEDTRKSGTLLRHFGIEKPLLAHHAHNEHRYAESIADRIASGETAGLMSDAGTPGISDPGFLLVRSCIAKGLAVHCLPGPSALLPALVQSGLPCDRFVFEGFLPHKKGRAGKIKQLSMEERTLVLYESPHRIQKTLAQLAEIMGKERPASISRELTKMFEETQRGTLGSLAEYYSQQTPKGEFVLVIGRAGNGSEDAKDQEEKGQA